MSNSYKKYPIYKQHFKGAKKQASRAFRRYTGDIPVRNKRFYSKVYDSWNVIDHWYIDLRNKQRFYRFKQILKELKENFFDLHLTEEEAYDMLEELKDLGDCFFYKKK